MSPLAYKARIAIAALLFATTWLLWSGMTKPLILGLGLASVFLVAGLAVRIGFFDQSVYSLHLARRLPRFWLWLLGEIVRTNLAVTLIVLSPRLPVSPRVVTIDASGLSPAAQAVLANAITLTPGTLTLDVNRDRLEVHCLTEAAARDLQSFAMLERARRLEKG